MNQTLSLFHPLVQRWFVHHVGQPTEVQQLAWPKIAQKKHLLITAPTGSGKTLTAFLWALDRLIQREWECGKTRILYVSPLKALNNDIQRNLIQPLSELQHEFETAGEFFPPIHVMTRSGDTDPGDRARMLRHPPEILITTPESLNLLVGSTRGRTILMDLTTVILDEIHSVADSKRGTHLITAVDRLVPLAGEFQRIALSATVRPLEKIAEWVAGRRMEKKGQETVYCPRPIETVDCRQSKEIRIQIRFPTLTERPSDDPTFWAPLIEEIKPIVRQNRSTLIFTNNRRTCERISFLLNQDEEHRIAYAHHGSLSRETRTEVEQRLKNGELAAIVATSSLELGIDIGALDVVLMIQTPPSIAATLQRIGRAGHGVGQISRGILFPTFGRDLLDAAVMGKGSLNKEIEEIHPIECPLDILAQIIVSLCGIEEWNVDDLFDFVQSSAPYAKLRRTDFERVLGMLSGQYFTKSLRHIPSLISWDRLDHTLRARNGALQKVLTEGGTIPDRGNFALRHRDNRAKIGELDEEFVWERRVGDTFMLGTQVWKIHQITHNDVLAVPTREPAMIVPFWKNEQIARDFSCSEKIGYFLQTANRDGGKKSFRKSLMDDYCMDERAADGLVDFIQRQKEFTHCDLPHRNHLVIEYSHIPGGRSDWHQIIVHTGWGARVNQPLSLILSTIWESQGYGHAEVVANNEGILFSVSEEVSIAGLLNVIPLENVEGLLRRKLESSGFFGARFRENAARALLMPRGKIGQRTPRWLHQLRSKELLATISEYEDFPILLETWRTCLQDEFDPISLQTVLQEIRSGEIAVTEIHTSIPSPFAESLVWNQTNRFVYMEDAAFSDRPSQLRNDLIQELIHHAYLRPEIPSELITRLEERLQRRIAGYAPESVSALLDWVKERLLIPEAEWDELCEAIRSHPDLKWNPIQEGIAQKVVAIALPNATQTAVVALENLPRLFKAMDDSIDTADFRRVDDPTQKIEIDWVRLQNRIAEPFNSTITARVSPDRSEEDESPFEDWLSQWLTFYGPISPSRIHDVLGVEASKIENALESLLEEERIVRGHLRKGNSEEEICDRENYERLLRLLHKESTPLFTPLPAERLPFFLAHQQGLTQRGESLEDLQRALESLLGYPSSAELWEREWLPARMRHYHPRWMDELTREAGLIWYGCGEEDITLCFQDQIDCFQREETVEDSSAATFDPTQAWFPDRRGKYDFAQLMETSHLTSDVLTERLWSAVWKGKVSNDAFSTLRKGIESRFKAWKIPDGSMYSGLAPEKRSRGRTSGFGRWKASRPFAGNWFLIEPPHPSDNALDALEREKDGVRLLLDRYGIVFRDLLQREMPALRWGILFKALWLMELSGEIAGGYFFEGIPGVQFARMHSLKSISTELHDKPVYWMNATDPASLCGLAIEGLKGELPARRPTTHLVYHGTKLVLVSYRQGKELDFRVSSDHPDLLSYLGLFGDWLGRNFQPMKSITIETINQEEAVKSLFLSPLRELYHVTLDYKKAILRKRYS